jgi:hypothetical protein
MKNKSFLNNLLQKLHLAYERANIIMIMAEVPEEIKSECKCDNCKCKNN